MSSTSVDLMNPVAVMEDLSLTADATKALAIGDEYHEGQGDALSVTSPIDGRELASFKMATPAQAEQAIDAAADVFAGWRDLPAPHRGEFVRQYGNTLREHKETLGALVSWEVGKTIQEGQGEVQEMIDICDFAVGLSRQLYGLTIASERPMHRLTEYWHPLGPIGCISAFNFPVAVWAWNSALAYVCGDPVVWKPSEKAPLTALACHTLLMKTCEAFGAPKALSSVVIGMRDVGHAVAASPKLPLISATGSVPMGKAVAETVGKRLGRSLLELGGNNAMIVTPSADMKLVLPAITFAAVGTAGQRCTSLRRIIVHQSVKDELVKKLQGIFEQLRIGHPLKPETLVQPLVDEAAYDGMQTAIANAKQQGGTVLCGGDRLTEADGADVPAGGVYVKPTLVELPSDAPILQTETFAPLTYIMTYETLDEAIALHNNVPQGLASAIFTSDVREAERFTSPAGSDCGIANVNIGTSGAEIGGAFGGEKETGGGRESGSDAWKNYMRRQTCTVNYSTDLPLAQGIKFDL